MRRQRDGEKVSVREKQVNKQRRWMSLLKRRLIQAIREQRESGSRGYIRAV